MTDFTVGDTLHFLFTTRSFSTGAPTTLAGTPVLSAYEDASITQITAGVSLGVDHDTVTGLNLATIVATGANGFETGKNYAVVITTGTVGGVSVVGEVVASFSLGRSAAAVDLANGTDGLGAIKAETALIVADTADMQPKLGTPAADVSADIAAIQTDTNDIQTRLPAALIGGRMDSDVEAINNDTDAAAKLAAHALETIPVTFSAGGSTTTAVLNLVDGAAASTTNDVYNGRILVFNNSTLNHQIAEITDYVGATKTATISAVTTAPGAAHTARMV